MTPSILLVTDRADLARLQAQMLIASGIRVSVLDQIAATSTAGLAGVRSYDLSLINMYEEENYGLEVCRKLRAGYYGPILNLLYEHDERVLLRAYDAGADDCLVQPISVRLLLAKVKAWLRRSGVPDIAFDYLEAYNFRFDPVKNEVITPDNQVVHLSLLEARFLHLLIVNRGGIVATDVIIQRVWPDNLTDEGDRHLLKALVYRLRRKIERDPARPKYLHTIPHRGYSFRSED